MRFVPAVIAAVCGVSIASAAPVQIASDSAFSAEGIGSFTGTLSYNPATAILEIVLTNTTPSGFITGLVFNVNSADPGASASYLPTMGDPFVDLGTESAPPFGGFDAGAALGGNFTGGGSPNAGVASGATRTFRFQVFASDAASLDEFDFISGSNGPNTADFLVRIRGIATGAGSDKVPGLIVMPTPLAASMGLAGLGAVAALRRRR